ncbi:MAG: hypothetical protein LLG04_13985 [Parachlamydia sp.]|nr:hypothetical protein [Parachlamydia sp.]
MELHAHTLFILEDDLTLELSPEKKDNMILINRTKHQTELTKVVPIL